METEEEFSKREQGRRARNEGRLTGGWRREKGKERRRDAGRGAVSA